MCIPAPKEAALPALNVPSMESASGLDLAGVPRGAAGLARLKLRTGATAAPTTGTTSKSSGTIAPSASGVDDSAPPFSRLTLPTGGLTLPIP